jgi:mevalonate kinase
MVHAFRRNDNAQPSPVIMTAASAPGKCILFGEHAVVYGQPAIAVAIEQRCEVIIEETTTENWIIDGLNYLPEKHPHIEGLRNRLWFQGPSLKLNIISEVPAGSGLGSSAALSIALAAAMRAKKGRRVGTDGSWHEGYSSEINQTDAYSYNLQKTDPGSICIGGKKLFGIDAIDSDELGILGHAVEAASQGGRASPTDTAAVSLGGAVLVSDKREESAEWQYSRNLKTPEGERKWEVHKISLPESFDEVSLVIGDTGVHAPTGDMVAGVAELLQKDPEKMQEIEAIGKLVRRATIAMKDGDLQALGNAMTENHLLLRGLGVSHPKLENLIKAAAPYSLGVKLTGAGGGGCMIALTTQPETVSQAIEMAGGTAYISKLGAGGVHLHQ